MNTTIVDIILHYLYIILQIIYRKESITNVYYLTLLKDLLPNQSYFPYTNSAITPENLHVILNDILINKRTKILEFGSGMSTILIAKLLQKNNLKSQLFSVDNDKEWVNIVEKALVNEGLEKYVKFCVAPISKRKPLIGWYNIEKLNIEIQGKFDCIIIDGPEAWNKSNMFSRYYAIKFLNGRLFDDYSIFLDNADRYGESKWLRKINHKMKFVKVTKSLAMYANDKKYNII